MTTSTDLPAGGSGGPVTADRTSGSRSAALDGVRGITIVLVVMGHTRLVWPDNPLYDVPLVRGVVRGGAVTVFFVIGGYLVSRTLLRLLDEGRMDPVVFYARRLVRLGVQLVPLLIVLIVISSVDPTDPYSTHQNVVSSVGVLTFTYNTTFLAHPSAVRADLGPLWYLCVQQQIYLVLPFVLLALHRRGRLLVLLMLALAVAVTVHRFDVVAAGDWARASVMTSTRSDGLFLGVALAVAEPWLRRSSRSGTVLLNLSLVAFAGLVLTGGEFGVRPYLHGWGVAGAVIATALAAGIMLAPNDTRGQRLLSVAPLAWLGRASLVIYLWHLPILFFVSRHVHDWTRPAQLLTVFVTLAAVTYVGHRYVEEPTRQFLSTNPWLNPQRSEQSEIVADGAVGECSR